MFTYRTRCAANIHDSPLMIARVNNFPCVSADITGHNMQKVFHLAIRNKQPAL